jgi:hypothetical protein
MKESMFIEIINAKCLDGLKMLVSFNNGEHRLFDFATIVDSYPVFAPLKDKATLRQFHISDTLEWCNGTIDIAPEYIFEHGELVDDENGLPVAAEAPIDYEK